MEWILDQVSISTRLIVYDIKKDWITVPFAFQSTK